jgi:methyl-accepting chemotaxis protein
MTQHNAALVEQTNAAIEQTEAQASELDKVVEVFRVEEDGRGKQRAKAERAAPPQRAPKAARGTYLSAGNAAIDKDWAEF